MKHLKLGTKVKDSVSKTEGMLTHLWVDMDLKKQYIYQPHGLNPESGQPVDTVVIEEARIKGGVEIESAIPTEVIGTKGTDEASGFSGTIVNITMHINGCIHVGIKPPGTLKATGATISSHEFDIRRVTGPGIKKLTEAEIATSQKKTPSPTEFNKTRR